MATAGLHDSELGELQRRLIILRVGLLLVVGVHQVQKRANQLLPCVTINITLRPFRNLLFGSQASNIKSSREEPVESTPHYPIETRLRENDGLNHPPHLRH